MIAEEDALLPLREPGTLAEAPLRPQIDPSRGFRKATAAALPRVGYAVSDERFLEELKGYVQFTEEHARALSSVSADMEAGFPAIVDRFYDAIEQNPQAAAVFTGGRAQIERQKNFLRAWLVGLFSGTYGLEYLQLRARIGRTHVRIRLDQRYMFTAMNLVREGLHVRLEQIPCADRALTHHAIDKICDIELAIMLQTYSEDYSARLRDNERLATLGQLAGFIGHELRNPLAVMETSLHLLKKRVPEGDEHARRHLNRLAEHVTVSSDIIEALLELARDRPLERGPVDLKELLDEVVAASARPENVAIDVRIADVLPVAQLDAKQMRHLAQNLLSNAIQEVSELAEGVERRIEIAVTRDGHDLVLSVEDTGRGVPESLRHRLFEPLVTGKAKGLGFGLALCRRVAEKHGGHVRAVNGKLGGARFEVHLPGAFSSAQAEPPASTMDPLP